MTMTRNDKIIIKMAEKASLEFRLRKIDEARNNILEEIKQ